MENNEVMSIESTGRSVDEAIFKGLQQMGISIDEVSIEILRTETKGILGIGAKPAIVRLTRKPPEDFSVADIIASKPQDKADAIPRRDRKNRREREKPAKEEKQPKPEKPEKPERFEKPAKLEKADKPEKVEKPEVISREITNEKAEKPERPEKPERQEKPEKPEKPERQEKPEKPEKPEKQEKPEKRRRPEKKRAPEAENAPDAAKPAEAEPAKEIVYTLEAAEGNPAAEFVKGLIERMGASGQVLAAMDDDTLRLRIDSEMMGMLIGHRGETLDAMQYLTGLVINKNRKTEGYTRVTLDTEEYREKREETLKQLAKKVAAQVRATGRPRVLEPMNPYERRVLHSTLQNNPDVTTHSEGEEPNRRVVVTPKRTRGRGQGPRGRNRRNGERRPSAAPTAEEGGNDTISREEYQRLYEAARAANPMFMSRPTKEE